MTNPNVISDSVFDEKPATKKTTVKKPRATTIAATTAPVAIEKAEVLEAMVDSEGGQAVISAPKTNKKPRSSNMQSKENNTLGSSAADLALNRKVDTTVTESGNTEDVAVWSDSNIRWSNFGTLSKGYNIIKKEAVDKWLTRRGVRKATPEELATHYVK